MVWKPGDKLPNSRNTIAAKNVRARRDADADAGIKRLPRIKRIKCMVCGRMMKAYSDAQGKVCLPCGRWMKSQRKANDGRL